MKKRFNIFINHPSHGLTDFEPWGDGLIAYQFIDRLARRGHQIYIATPIARLRNALHPNVHMHLVNTRSKYEVAYPSWKHRIEYSLHVRRLFQQLQKEIKFDIIHQLNPVTSGVNLLLPTSGIPFVMGLVWPQWPSATPRSGLAGMCLTATRNLLRWDLFRRATCILIAVPGSRKFVANSPAIQSRIRLLHCGIDTKQFSPKEEPLAESEFDPHILFLAALHKDKGIYTLLEAFESVVRSVPQARLTIAGDGPEREEVERTVSGLSSSNRISMVGSLPREKVVDAFRSCAAYCLPSFGEPFGMSALEAMSCGKPLVVTAAGGLDYLVNEKGGVKVPVGDPKKLAEALIRLLKDPLLCKQMGEQNRELIVSAYDWEVVIGRLEQIYEQTIHGQRELP